MVRDILNRPLIGCSVIFILIIGGPTYCIADHLRRSDNFVKECIRQAPIGGTTLQDIHKERACEGLQSTAADAGWGIPEVNETTFKDFWEAEIRSNPGILDR